MPATWTYLTKRLAKDRHVKRGDAKFAIYAGAWYQYSMVRQWSAPRPSIDRWDLARASYNAGLGNLLKAQKACGGKNLYSEIIACLPDITGHRSKETIGYNIKIHKWYRRMKR